MDVVTMEQRRAKFAYDKVLEVATLSIRDSNDIERGPDVGSKYRSYVKSAPVLILTNGLGGALAFYQSKIKAGAEITGSESEEESEPGRVPFTRLPEKIRENMETEGEFSVDRLAYAYLYKHIAEWLAQTVTNSQDPLQYYITSNSLEAIRMTEEAIAFLNWLKRFAEAMLKKEEEGGS